MDDFKTVDQLNVENPEPGIYLNVPDSVYNKIGAIRHSLLRTIIDKTPAHFKIKEDNPDFTTTKAQVLGKVAHAQLLEEERVEKDFWLVPPQNKNSHAFKYAVADIFPEAGITKDHSWTQIQELISEIYPDKIQASPEDIHKGQAMINKLKYDDKEYWNWKLHNIMNEGRFETEVVFIWKDKRTGLMLKCKFDGYNFTLELGFDYKTGAQANGRELKKNAILAQEKEAPYCHAWYEFQFDNSIVSRSTGEEWAVARQQYEAGLSRLHRARESGIYKGYEHHDGDNVFPIVLKYDDYQDFRNDPFQEDEADLPFETDENATESNQITKKD